MFYRLLFLLCFPFLCLRADDLTHVGPAPEWVKPCDFSLDAPLKPSQEHEQCLLMDIQRNWEEKTLFLHIVEKIVDQVVIEDVSQIRVNYDPAYQKAVIHQIRVFRNGQWSDRLMTSRHDHLQREIGLDYHLFSGDWTHVYFLNDIRVGDIIDFSYSIIGEHPIFSSHLIDTIQLQYSSVYEKSYHRILIHPDRAFAMKSFNASLQPIITDLSPTLREYVWEAIETEPGCDDDDQPAWHIRRAHIQISQYATWKELIDQLVPLYPLFTDNPSPEMIDLVKKWTDFTDDTVQRATLALRFVQDEIRYLGFEEGTGGVKPRDPRVILERRYGDCKDKSVLLRSLLHLMGITSHSVLVHASKGKLLPERLPSPSVFNHAVLQIHIDNTLYYVDPTRSLQGGALQDNYFPSYKWGLVISEDSTGLTLLPEFPARPLTVIETSITVTSPTSAELHTHTTVYGCDADRMRIVVKSLGLKKTRELFLEIIQNQYKGASVISATMFTDDREKNIVSFQESYKIPIRSRAKKTLKVFSDAISSLDDLISPERTSPFALSYPEWIQEHIHVENPFNIWSADSENVTFDNESIHYHFDMQKQGHSADFTLELRHLQDHVPLSAIQDYWNIMREIKPNLSLELVIVAPEGK